MRRFENIAVNAFVEVIRQPIFRLLLTGSVFFKLFLAVRYCCAFGKEGKPAFACPLA